ncbi:MAG: amino acid racemase [Blastocatellia bacterium]
MNGKTKQQVLGVLGGMGPLASAEFIKTIYEVNLGCKEQESPVVIMYSDPTFPDRTEMFFKGRDDLLLDPLVDALTCLLDMGASRIVICCVTIHYLLPRLPQHLKDRVISLVDLVIDRLAETGSKHLLISSNGTRKMEIFQNHPRWASVSDYVVFPDETDQEQLHSLIYEVKKNHSLDEICSFVLSRLAKYRLSGFIVGCTEAHMAAKHLLLSNVNEIQIDCVDPLMIVAKGGRDGRFYE